MRILFFDIDTLRKDHMSCYGYYRDTTPNIDKISEEGVRFENYYCSDAPCLPSRASLVRGMFGIRNGAVGHGGTAADPHLYGINRELKNPLDENNLHNIFRKNGMKTTSISTFAERHSSWWFNAGFNELYNVGKGGQESGEEILPIALEWLDKNGSDDDWFLHINLWDPHTPYRAPESFGNPFAESPFLSWIDDDVLKLHLEHVGPHSINEINMYNDNTNPKYPRHPGKANNLEEVKVLFDGYDTGILYADYIVGKIMEKVKMLNILDDLAIIVTSDHGENMGELGLYAEHATADVITCNIPMIIRWPGMKKNHVDKGFHYSLDLLPTLCDLLDVEKSTHWDGQSYSKVLEKGLDISRESLVLSQMAHVCQRSARFEDWLYIRTYHDGFHLFDKEMLFNIKDDPYEQRDVKDRYPEICTQGAKIIKDWVDEQLLKDPTHCDPLWTVLREGGPHHTRGYLLNYLERLEKTGRSEGASQLREKYSINKEGDKK